MTSTPCQSRKCKKAVPMKAERLVSSVPKYLCTMPSAQRTSDKPWMQAHRYPLRQLEHLTMFLHPFVLQIHDNGVHEEDKKKR